MISSEASVLRETLALILSTRFGFEANPHPENARSAEAGQRLLAAQLEAQGDRDLAHALRADLGPR